MTKKRVLILGGALDQKLLVDVFRARGFYTIIADYYENPPAKETADKHYRVSTYDTEAILEIARSEEVAYVTTISTDQPLLVAAHVSETLGLPFHLSYETARNTTNKSYMKQILTQHEIPTSRYVIIREPGDLHLLDRISFPAIMKPVDSSGSRGVFIIKSPEEALRHLNQCFAISGTATVIVEEFMQGVEISVDALLHDGNAQVIMITEFLKMTSQDSTPLCSGNLYPADISRQARDKAALICKQIGDAFQIDNTPLFVQMIVSGDDVKVIEFSARIAGGSKPYFIPKVSGVHLADVYVSLLLQEPVRITPKYLDGVATINFLYCHPGVFQCFEGHESLLETGMMDQLMQYKSAGSPIKGICDGSERVGAFFVTAPDLDKAKHKSRQVYERLQALDTNGHDMLYHDIVLL